MRNQFKSINNLLEYFVPINISDFNIFKSFINVGIFRFFSKEIKYFKLLYQYSKDRKDGNNDDKIIHEKCDGKSFTVTFVLTDKNRIFGGFTEVPWDQNEDGKIGDKGFLFSINNREIYYPKYRYFIYCIKNAGPYFFRGFYISLIFGFDETDSTNFYSQFDEVIEKKNFLAGDEFFTVKDYAVYQIEIL